MAEAIRWDMRACVFMLGLLKSCHALLPDQTPGQGNP